MKAYFYPYGCYTSDCCQTYFQTEAQHLEKVSYKTTQMSFLKDAWWDGYEVFIQNLSGVFVKICNENKLTYKELRHSHNIFKIWEAGGFALDEYKGEVNEN